MKSIFKMSLLATIFSLAMGCQQEETEKVKTASVGASVIEEGVIFTTENDKMAYAIGTSLAQYLKVHLEKQEDIGLILNSDQVLEGVQDAFRGHSKLSSEETQAILQSLEQRIAQMVQTQSEEGSTGVVKAGHDFRSAFAKVQGVITTSSGLMYQVESLGEGERPTAEDTVIVHYKGTLTDGTQFDSSYDRNQAATFPLNQVIPGWVEGIQLMPVGSKFKFIIPPELAYGKNDTPAIPANSTLIFNVELLEIKSKPVKK
ncbi:FKBP-type peptidyl-prolyl cis-trans isomerase [Candidatus Enterovibrio altilux]|uniref:Peptidyl-prolyl cis-trans isomerase n=1 Tax=Candidatus Enterovibrio altilux TaxID=1927128 RepID=A0A291B9B7_9GAMM|nr:FKBP-type peptidyl-prolyl cis-trans isomerase [Candidatus Enterovibrio luxaltus]ATF09608.1 FKBP-type peptidyl-prolyl cis-trans isomerase FkpA precursor [Candidatus Enterovibrio luxaltus]